MKNAKKAMSLIKEFRLLQDEIYESIMAEIDEIEPMKDVTPIGNGSVKIATVKLSTIAKNGFNLSPEYYIQDVQREAIKKHLSKKGKDIDRITDCIKEMVDTKMIKGSTSDKHIQLNASSVKALTEIYQNLIAD